MRRFIRENFIFLVLSVGLFLSLYGIFNALRINVTSSLPQTLFVAFPIKEIKKFSYVSFYHPGSSIPLVKEIRGMPGDEIELKSGHLFVSGQDCGSPMNISKSGRVYQYNTCQKIPPGYVYVYSSHPESFDSRYAEFGLVQIKDLKEELWPLF